MAVGHAGKKRWEFYLIFEEQLIVSTIGSVMDTSSEAVSVMLMNASRYVAKQLVERMKEHFPNSEQFELKEEQLLTYDQFQKVFEKQSPQYSLLFDTGKGYFAYCATASEHPAPRGCWPGWRWYRSLPPAHSV